MTDGTVTLGTPRARGTPNQGGRLKDGTSTPRATIVAATITAAAGILAALIAAGVAIHNSGSSAPPSATTTATSAPVPPSPRRPAPAPTVFATVVHTGSIGVYKHQQPTNQSTQSYGPGEGERIPVVCQVRDGQPVTDPDSTPGLPENWPVWDKLADGYFVTDLYTDLPKDPGPTPPLGLPLC